MNIITTPKKKRWILLVYWKYIRKYKLLVRFLARGTMRSGGRENHLQHSARHLPP